MAAANENVTHIETKAGGNTYEIIFQLFDPIENIHSDLIEKCTVQSDRGNNYIIVEYHYDANNILVTPVKTELDPAY